MKEILKNLKFEDGIYWDTNKSEISYPTKGNTICFDVEDDSFWFEHRNNITLHLCEKYLKKSALFIDIGGGNGFITKMLQDHGFEVLLLEPGFDGVKNAKIRGVNNIICAALHNTVLPDNIFDDAGTFDVIEHIENDDSFIQLIHKKMKKSSYLIITVPAFNILWSNEDVKAGHYRRYTKSKMKSLLQKNGFTITYVSYFFSFLFLPILILRTLKTLLKINTLNETQQIKNDHKKTNWILKIFMNIELFFIKQGWSIPFGSSLIAIAQKK